MHDVGVSSDEAAVTLGEHDRALLATAGCTGELTATALVGGFRNRMLLVSTAERQVVLRKWSHGVDAATTELAALREAAADGIPVPEVLAADGARAVLSHVDGELASLVLRDATRKQAEQIGERIGALVPAIAARPRHTAGLAIPGTDPIQFTPWERPPSELFEDLLGRARHAPRGWTGWASGYAELMDYFLARPARSHSDLNPKNVLLRKRDREYSVAALLDWEFTCAAPAEHDLGNLLRFERQSSVLGPFGKGVVLGSGADRDQVVLARRLDLFAIAELFTRPELADTRHRQLYADLSQLATEQLTAATL